MSLLARGDVQQSRREAHAPLHPRGLAVLQQEPRHGHAEAQLHREQCSPRVQPTQDIDRQHHEMEAHGNVNVYINNEIPPNL